MEQKYIYTVLASTPYRMGSFISAVTGYEYNHSGLALSSDIKYVYSFARRFESAPFYGGFVTESVLRYSSKGKIAKIKIFKIPVTDKNFEMLKNEIREFRKNSESYIYNYASAISVPLGYSVKVPKAYTCVEFVLSMLKKYADIPQLENKKFLSIEQLDEILSPYFCYEGSAKPFLEKGSWNGDSFRTKLSPGQRAAKTFGVFCELGKRCIKKAP